MKKTLLISLILLSGIATYYYPNLSNTLNVATGFSAKNICSGHFISKFHPDIIAVEALKPIDSTFDYVSYEVDNTNKKVSASIAGYFERHAVYRPGLGCTLLTSGQQTISTGIKPLYTPQLPRYEPWPDGLAVVSQTSNDINYKLLNLAINAAFSEPESTGKRYTKAVLVIHKGKLVAERYADGVGIHTPLLSWSMAKSITGLQVGVLVKAGKLNLQKPAIVPLWSEKDDPRSIITLDQMMRMSSGLEFNETYGINTDASRMLSVESDAAAYAANKPLSFTPDSHWSYSSGTTNIISGIVKRTIGGDFQQYYEHAQSQLFHPLGIYSAHQETDASDTFIGSSFFYATARDWVKLGQLMLQNGQWKGKQILPAGWVKYSTTPTKTAPLNQYGAQFWLNADPDSSDDHRTWPSVPTDAYYMGGYQGQYIVIVPSKDLIIARFGFTKPDTSSGIEKLISNAIGAIGTSSL